MQKTLVVITGPTGVGKSAVALELAEMLGAEIISADSRQIYKDIPIITAAPEPPDLARVPHHFVGTLPLDAYFSAAQFEQEALNLLPALFNKNDVAICCGGSMLYVDALCNGLDSLPTISEEVRTRVKRMQQEIGHEGLLAFLQNLDPEYYAQVDPQNTKRIMHAIEICLQSGTTFSSLRSGSKRERPFRILKFMLDAPRPVLFDRINSRVLKMLECGMEQEARRVFPLRHLNSLNTVGCKEMFEYIAGNWDLDFAIARLQKNTRVYAKKQLTWFARDKEILRLNTPDYAGATAIATALCAAIQRD